jgi:hypothetical protein
VLVSPSGVCLCSRCTLPSARRCHIELLSGGCGCWLTCHFRYHLETEPASLRSLCTEAACSALLRACTTHHPPPPAVWLTIRPMFSDSRRLFFRFRRLFQPQSHVDKPTSRALSSASLEPLGRRPPITRSMLSRASRAAACRLHAAAGVRLTAARATHCRRRARLPLRPPSRAAHGVGELVAAATESAHSVLVPPPVASSSKAGRRADLDDPSRRSRQRSASSSTRCTTCSGRATPRSTRSQSTL